MDFNKQKVKMAGLFLLVLLSGIALGWVIRSNWEGSQEAEEKEYHEGQWEYINPLLSCGDMGEQIGREITPFKHVVQKKVDEFIKGGKARQVSVYYRDLNNGPWFGIGEKETFTPASLLKVPELMDYFKQAEKTPGILREKITYNGNNFNADAGETIYPAAQAEYGKTYTVDQLLRLMIVNSDNNALMLLGNRGWSFLDRIYTVMGLPIPEFSGENYQITVKDFAEFFRILFNASYLDQEMSDKALQMLASTDFRRGLVAGVPENIIVAHKFGERVTQEEKQLHDCGIVYYPNRPYLLCVMTKGNNMGDLISVISGISRTAYDEVNQQYGKKAKS
jgi:beta-lactamase class A